MKASKRTVYELLPIGRDEPGTAGAYCVRIRVVLTVPGVVSETIDRRPFLTTGTPESIAARLIEKGLTVTWTGTARNGNPVIESVTETDFSPLT